MENIDKSQWLITVLHLKEASRLIINNEPEISLTLLKLADALMQSKGLLSADIENAEQIIKEITGNEQTVNIHRADNK